jgi:4-hydroxy-2-oxoheptanedioate aldolase
MTLPEIKRRLHSGERVYGTLIVSPSPRWPDSVARIGLDFVFIDTEHIALDRHQLSWMCQTYRALGLPAIVRIPSPDPYLASMALDGGACGIIAPYVETAAQARELVGAVKLRPLKGKRLGGILNRTESPEPDLNAYLEQRSADNLVILNIESVPAVAALDEILAVPGIDAVLIGPHDLSCSMGYPEQYDRPEFEQTVRRVFERARAKGVGAGIHSWMGLSREAEWGRAGANLIIHEADISIFVRTATAELRELRAMLGDAPSGKRGPDSAI